VRKREGGRDKGAGARARRDDTYGSEGQVVKDLSAVLPGVGAGVLLLALVVEAVHLSDLARLVVATQQRDLLRIPRLEYQEQGKGLQAVVASVDKVTLQTKR